MKNGRMVTVSVAAVILGAALMTSGCSMLTEVNAAQGGILSSEGFEETSLAARESEPSDGMNRLERIKEQGYIEVATEPYFAPFEFIDPLKSGDDKYVGADIELARYIADKLGVECRIVPLEFTAVLSSVTEGKYDLAISALAYSPARAEAMEMSDGYYFSDEAVQYGLLVRDEDINTIKTTADLGDKVVVVQSGSIQEGFAADQLPEGCAELKRVSATTDGFLMVQEGKADACITATSTAELYLAANSGCGMSIAPDISFEVDEETQGTRIGIKKGETELLNEVNSIIAEVTESGLYSEWYEKYSEYAAELGI